MEGFISWLQQPIAEGAPELRIWMAFAAGLALALLALLLTALVKRRRKKRRVEAEKPRQEPQTQRPAPLPALELANLQGLGSREEQQDAFGLSRVEEYGKQGLLAVLCDGMGGMAEGGMIAAGTVAELLGAFPWQEDAGVEGWIRRRSASVYRQFLGHGGTTLVAALLRGDALSFWCVGDSDLFLYRNGGLYGLNVRQEFKNDLILRALNGTVALEDAFSDRQAGALSQYIGKADVRCDRTRIPLRLLPGDVLLLCSDGVSDTLTLKQIRQAMALSPQACCDKLEEDILAAAKPNQDNYTAILLKYNGMGEENGSWKKTEEPQSAS